MSGDINNPASEFLGEIEEHFNSLLGQGRGTMVLMGILERHGSQDIYLSKVPERMRQERDRQINSMFRGNYKELKTRLQEMGISLSLRQLRRIVD